MENSLSKIVGIVIAFILMFIIPILYMFEIQDETTRIFVLTKTTEFVDSVRNLGYITPRMYNEYKNSLNATGNIYDVEIEHFHNSFDPIYDDPTVHSSFQDDYNVNRDVYFTDDILSKLFPNNGIGDRIYTLSQGDYFIVSVKNKNKTMATRIQELLYNASFPAEKIIIRYGGMVKDENY